MFDKFRANTRALGPINGTLYSVDRVVQRLFGKSLVYSYLIVSQPVAELPWLPAGRGRSVEIRPLAPGEKALLDLPLDQRVLDYRFGQGAVCFGAFMGGAIVGCLWLCLGDYREDEVRCVFSPGPHGRAAWDFDVYVEPRYRTGVVFLRLWDTANAFLRERGYRWSLSRISGFNAGSLAAHARLGAVCRARLLFFRIGIWQLSLATVAPRLHISLARSNAPLYVLSGGAAETGVPNDSLTVMGH